MRKHATVILAPVLIMALMFSSLTACERSVPERATPTLSKAKVVMSPQPPPATAEKAPTTVSVLSGQAGGTPTPTIVWDVPTFTPTPGSPTSQPAAPSSTPTMVPPPSGGTLTHRVEWGDTLYSLAARYGTTVEAIVAANNLPNANFIRVGQTLIIPQGGQAAPVTQPSGGQTTYVVQPGDTLYRIALQFNTTVSAIAQANGIVNPAFIRAGQTLVIPGAGTGTTSSQGSRLYVVQAGDTLTTIAARFGTTVWAIVAANNLPNANWIRAGQTLIIPAP